MANLQIDSGKQLILHVSFQTVWHFILSDLLQVFISGLGSKLVLREFGELFQIHCPFVQMDICPELSSNQDLKATNTPLIRPIHDLGKSLVLR